MKLEGKRVLITGADGFIGSHLSEKLVELGCRVRCLVMYNSLNSWGWLDSVDPSLQAEMEIFPGDIRDASRVADAVKGCECVFHLAALVAIPYSYRSPHSYIETNINGTLNILNAVRSAAVQKLIHTSTSEVYGTARYVPIDEKHPLQGQSPYSASKIGADQLALSFYRSFDTPVAIIRPFNAYGPRQSARAVIPAIITQLLHDQNHVELGSLHPTRNFNYVEDTVNGFIAMAKADAAVGEVINIGSNYELSIKELVRTIADLMNVKIQVKSDRERIRPGKSEVDRLAADNTKARRVLGWQPVYDGYEGLRQGLARTIEWLAVPSNLSRYRPRIYTL